MRLKRLRARAAGELKKRADRTTSPTVHRHLYRAIKTVYPLKRKVPQGQAFIPYKQLDQEAKDAIARIQAHTKIELATIMSAPVSGITFTVAFISAIAQPPSLRLFIPPILVAGGVMGANFIMLSKLKSSRDQAQRDMNFLSGYMQRTSSSRIGRLRSKYNFFYLNPKLKGVVLMKLAPKAVEYMGSLKKGEVVVLGKSGEVLYHGPERRQDTDRRTVKRRTKRRRSDEGKQTQRW